MANNYVEIALHGGEARGRNGWFTPVEAEVGFQDRGHYPKAFSYFNVYSKQRGQVAPIILELVPGDAIRIGANIILMSGEVDGDPILKKSLESLIKRVSQNSKVRT